MHGRDLVILPRAGVNLLIPSSYGDLNMNLLPSSVRVSIRTRRGEAKTKENGDLRAVRQAPQSRKNDPQMRYRLPPYAMELYVLEACVDLGVVEAKFCAQLCQIWEEQSCENCGSRPNLDLIIFPGICCDSATSNMSLRVGWVRKRSAAGRGLIKTVINRSGHLEGGSRVWVGSSNVALIPMYHV
jgi:hypothetical protein